MISKIFALLLAIGLITFATIQIIYFVKDLKNRKNVKSIEKEQN